MYFSYPKDVDEVLASLPVTLEECNHRIVEFSLVYQKLYIHDPDTAELLLRSASHLKYRQILLSNDHSEQSEAFVQCYEVTLPRMIWKSEMRSDYLFEADWELAAEIKNGRTLDEFFDESRDVYELQMLHLPCNADINNYFLDRLFFETPEDVESVDVSSPPDVKAKICDVRFIGGKLRKRTGATAIVESSSRRGERLPMFGPGRYSVKQLGKRYESYAPTQLVYANEFAVMSRMSDGLSRFLSACGVTIYSGQNYSMFPLLKRYSQWKRRKRNRDVRTLQECSYQSMMHSWLMGYRK